MDSEGFVRGITYVSIPLRGKGKGKKMFDNYSFRHVQEKFPSPYGERVKESHNELCASGEEFYLVSIPLRGKGKGK